MTTNILNAEPITVLTADFLFPCDTNTMLPTGEHDLKAEEIANKTAEAHGFKPTEPWTFTIGGITMSGSEPELGVALFGGEECEIIAKAVSGNITVQFLMYD